MPVPDRAAGVRRRSVDLSRPQRIHIVGAGGSGMSAIAAVLVAMGHQVSGSDIADSQALRRLAELGVAVRVAHDAVAVADADLVAVSSAIPPSNVEVAEATRMGLPVLRRADILTAICALRRTLAVAGTHGKTTTSSMLAVILAAAGFDPSFIIGGEIHGIGGGAAWTNGEWMVVEADESDGTFLELDPFGVAVTSVEADHLDYYGDLAGMVRAFEDFLGAAPGPRVVCIDAPGGAALAAAAGGGDDGLAGGEGVTTYGTSEGAGFRMTGVRSDRRTSRFDLTVHGVDLGEVLVGIPGEHNARNACAALALARAVGVPWPSALRALAGYRGVARRFEWRGSQHGVTYVDDYGHLPGEVKPVLATAQAGGWRRVVAVFQPHRYSRTEALWADFADAFVDADRLIVTDVYSAGETPRPGVSGRLIADAVSAAHPDAEVQYCAGRPELVELLSSTLQPGDLCLTLGAGDLTSLPDDLLRAGASGARAAESPATESLATESPATESPGPYGAAEDSPGPTPEESTAKPESSTGRRP